MCSIQSRFRWTISSRNLRETVCIVFLVMAPMASVLTGCRSDKKPDKLLPKDQMAKVLMDFYIREARVNNLHLNRDSAKVLIQHFRKSYEKSSQIPDSLVELSFQYYMAYPKEMGEIYDRVIDSLVLMEQRAGMKRRAK